MMTNDNFLYVITGPTASGKTAKAVALAEAIDAEIISADSRQIYRGMDIGTGKDLNEYKSVPYHLIDICNAGYRYNLFEYLRDYKIAYDDIRSRGKHVILCGGTGLYVESVLIGRELPPVPENKELREELKEKSLTELTEILEQYKTLHNITDVDNCKRAIRAIEIQKYYHDNPASKDYTPACKKRNFDRRRHRQGKSQKKNIHEAAIKAQRRNDRRSIKALGRWSLSRIINLLWIGIQICDSICNRRIIL